MNIDKWIINFTATLECGRWPYTDSFCIFNFFHIPKVICKRCFAYYFHLFRPTFFQSKWLNIFKLTIQNHTSRIHPWRGSYTSTLHTLPFYLNYAIILYTFYTWKKHDWCSNKMRCFITYFITIWILRFF